MYTYNVVYYCNFLYTFYVLQQCNFLFTYLQCSVTFCVIGILRENQIKAQAMIVVILFNYHALIVISDDFY